MPRKKGKAKNFRVLEVKEKEKKIETFLFPQILFFIHLCFSAVVNQREREREREALTLFFPLRISHTHRN